MSSQTAYPIYDALSAPLRTGSGGAYSRAAARVLEFVASPVEVDATAPVLTPVSPTPGSPVAPTTPLVCRIEDNKGFSLREIWARFSGANQWEQVYSDEAFVAPYASSSVALEFGTPGPSFYDRRTYTIRRTPGWPAKQFVRLRFTVVDSAGNLLVLVA